MAEVVTFELGDFALQRGRILPGAQLVYATYGTLADDGSNAVLYPTSYGAQHTDIDWLIGKEECSTPSAISSSSRICSPTVFPPVLVTV